MRLTSEDLRESKVFMYWIVVKRWAAYFYNLTTYEVELLMALHCKKRFGRDGYDKSERPLSWEKKRFHKLKKEGWIDIYRHWMKNKDKKNIYKPSRKTNEMVNKIYRILLGEEELPVNRENPFMKNETYTDKMMLSAINDMKEDYKNPKAVY